MRKAKTLFLDPRFLRGVVFAASVFFIVLGIRNPYLNNNHGPKQRPRAVIEKISKASEEVTKKISDEFGFEHTTTVPNFEPRVFWISRKSLPTHSLPEVVASHLIARAPPIDCHS